MAVLSLHCGHDANLELLHELLLQECLQSAKSVALAVKITSALMALLKSIAPTSKFYFLIKVLTRVFLLEVCV